CDDSSVGFCNEDIGVAEGNAIPARYLGDHRFDAVGGGVDDDKVIVRTWGNVSGVCSRVDDNLVAVAADTGQSDGFLGGDVQLRCRRLAGGRGWGRGWGGCACWEGAAGVAVGVAQLAVRRVAVVIATTPATGLNIELTPLALSGTTRRNGAS